MRDDGGLAATVIILPLVIIAVWMGIQAALVMHTRNAAQAAAQDASIAIATGSGGTGVGADTFNDTAGGFATLTGISPVHGDDTITVTVQAEVTTIIPFGDFTVSETASSPLEQFIPESERP